MTYEQAAKLLGETIAVVAVEDGPEWALCESRHLGGRYHRRYSFTDLQERGGPSAVVGGHAMRRFPHLVQEAAGKGLRVYLCRGRVQVDPVKEPK